MKTSSQKYWVLANGIGLTAYLLVSSQGWAPHGKEGQNGGPAVIALALITLPVLATFALANLIWCVKAVVQLRSRNPRPLLVWFSMVLLWSGALAYDYSRQYKGTDAVQLNEWK